MDADRTGGVVGRVVVGVTKSLSGLHALRVGVAHARQQRMPLHAVRTWEPPPDPDVLSGSGPAERPLASTAASVVASAFAETMGAVPGDVEVRTVVLPDSPGPVLVDYACRDGDLLVLGSGARGRLRRWRSSSVVRYCLARAGCPVLVVPPPPLTRTGSPRSLMRELRRDIDDLGQLTDRPADPPADG